jgi:hypothetical protein
VNAPSPGWYPDPRDPTRRRRWDGERWTHDVADGAVADGDPGTAGAAPGDGRGRTIVLSALLVVVLALVGTVSFLVLGSDGDDAPTLTAAEQADDDREGGEGRDGPAETDPPDEGAADGPPEDDQDAAPADTEATLEEIDLDGQCTAVIDVSTDDPALARAWDHDCTYAPVELADDETRWIVVVASLNGGDFTGEEALDRASQEGLAGQVLWSSHYPSLNPDLWVVYDGPFESESAASSASSRFAGGAYPRELADDPSRRYCLASDGCTGERS